MLRCVRLQNDAWAVGLRGVRPVAEAERQRERDTSQELSAAQSFSLYWLRGLAGVPVWLLRVLCCAQHCAHIIVSMMHACKWKRNRGQRSQCKQDHYWGRHQFVLQ